MKDVSEFPIKKYDAVLVKDREQEKWDLEVFMRLDASTLNDYPFETFTEGWSQIAPLKGNEGKEHTSDDVFDLWDVDRLKKEGFYDIS